MEIKKKAKKVFAVMSTECLNGNKDYEGVSGNDLYHTERSNFMNGNRMFDLAERLTKLRDEKGDVESELKVINGDIEKVSAELIDLMADNETPSFTHSGFTYSLSTRRFASAINADGGDDENGGGKEALYAELRNHGLSYLFTVNPMTLTGFVKDMAEEYAELHDGAEGLPDWLADKVKLFDKVSVSVRKAARK